MQNLVAGCHTEWVYVGGPKKLGEGCWGPSPYGQGACLTLEKRPSLRRVTMLNLVILHQTVQVYVQRSNGTGVRTEIKRYRCMYRDQTVQVYVIKRYRCTYRDPPEKLGPAHPAFQSQSRSLEQLLTDLPIASY